MKTFHLRGGNPGCDGGPDLGASAPNTVLVFVILVGLGVAITGWALLGRRGSQVHP